MRSGFRFAYDKKEKQKFEKEGRVYNPGMKNHGMKIPHRQAPKHKEGTQAWVKYVSQVSKNKSPKSIQKLAGTLRKESEKRLKKRKTFKAKK